ncbi:RNA ligase [uncultured Methylobacterium sp.]|uniref:RNA ligase n=1 Tax=uncultured Methylobacterium sp. TaxID=157278 RepID=UPI0035CAFEBC
MIDYVFAVPETFGSAVSRECRGLKFDADGRIIGRPFHKFFNLGERERIEDIDWSAPHCILDKLDGSMVHPVLLDSTLVFMTRMGATVQAALAQTHADEGVLGLSRHLLAGGITPIFEFTSPGNRIVVAYDTPALTLLAARAMVSGTYLPQADLVRLAERFGVRAVTVAGRIADPKRFVARARQEAGIEGYVVCFDDGHRLKLKTDGYVLRHKALAGVQFEKNVLAWVATGAVDDVVAILPPDIAARVLDYQGTVNAALAARAREIRAFVDENRSLARKDFAALTMQRFDKRLTQAVFTAYDGKDPSIALQMLATRAAASDLKVDAVRDLFGMRWSVEGLGLPELEA